MTQARQPRRTSRRRAVLAALLVSALVAAAGLWLVLREREDPLTRAREYAAQVAAGLSQGQLPPSLDVPDRALAQEDLRWMVKGMGSLPHRVTVAGVRLDSQQRRGEVTLEHAWEIHAEKPPWSYRTTLPIESVEEASGGRGWRGSWSPAVLQPDLVAGEGLRATRVAPERGEILGAGGQVLVRERTVVRIGIDKVRAGGAQVAARSAAQLARLLDLKVDPYVQAVAAAGERAFVEALVLRDTDAQLAQVRERVARIPGTNMVGASLPLPPSAQFARPILGTVGPATAEIIDASGGEVRVGDLVGLSGLQRTHDARLRGIPGYVVEAYAVDRSEEARTLTEVPARDGEAVSVTLDEKVQAAAEAALAPLAPASALVAIRPSDGHVLAAASGPGSEGFSTATLGLYPPGSTFKVVTALALLREGVGVESQLPCTRTITVDGREFTNHSGYPASALGEISLREAFAHSCNTAFIAGRERIGPEGLAVAAASLGLTAGPGLGVPAEFGAVPPATGATEAAAATIGQGSVTASPLGMAIVAAGVAQGSTVTPVLVTTPRQSSGVVPRPAAPLTDSEARALRTLMGAVVQRGSAAFLRGLPGPAVLAKTGTAEYGDQVPPRTHAWIIAIRGDLAVAVFVADGEGGASTAGPVLNDFLGALD